MTNNKILINIKNIDEIEKYKEIGITNFLFAIENFSLQEEVFKLSALRKIEGNIYLNLDKILNTFEIEKFKELIPELDFVSGILFEDIGIYQALKNTDIPLIWNQKHFVINSQSINFWLHLVDSAVLANELTKIEIIKILKNVIKPVILPVYGFNQAMYSRRYLLTTYNKYHKLKLKKEALLKIDDKHAFITKETDDGTVLYYHKPFNYLPYLENIEDEKVKFYYIDNIEKAEDVIELLNGVYHESVEEFFNHKTIYKLEEK